MLKLLQIGGLLTVLGGILSVDLYLYDKVYGGWSTAESLAIAEVESRGIAAEHYQTIDHDSSVRVLFSKPEHGHYVDVILRKDRQGKWQVHTFNKDFVPWKKDVQASR